MNAQSSRSHTLFLLYITGTHAASGQTLSGGLNLVDLAGSERTGRSGAEGQRMKEACAINKSLSTLGDVFKAIGEGAKHVPYRNSKLTHLLAPCLGGDGKTLMLVNVAPEPESAEAACTRCSFRQGERGGAGGGGGGERAKRRGAAAGCPAYTARPAVAPGARRRGSRAQRRGVGDASAPARAARAREHGGGRGRRHDTAPGGARKTPAPSTRTPRAALEGAQPLVQMAEEVH